MDTVQQAKLLVEEMSGEERIRYLRELLKDHCDFENTIDGYITVCELCTKLATNNANYKWIESEGGTCQRCERMTCRDCKGRRFCCDDCRKTGSWERWWKKCDKSNAKRRCKGLEELEVYKGSVCRECVTETCPYCPPPVVKPAKVSSSD